MRSRNHINEKKILVIGLGEIGYSDAEYLYSIGANVDGYDVSDKAIERAMSAGIISGRAVDFSGYDYYLICISTHRPDDMFTPYDDGITEIAYRIAKEGKAGGLVCIDSTVPKGTSNKVLEILKHKLHVVHVPHRYYGAEKNIHGVNQMRVIGGCSECCVVEGKRFYEDLLSIPLHPVSAIEVAELTKIVENAHRFVEIAFAEELRMVCTSIGINFEELRRAVNTKWNVRILEAREGIGGHCLPKDSEMLLNVTKNVLDSSIVSAAKLSDHRYRYFLSKQSISPHVEIGKPKNEVGHNLS